jgi:guanylate kinase
MNNDSGGVLFVLSGSSGAGKSTVIRELFKRCPDLYFSVSATTRLPRFGEVDGKSYRFVSREYFKEMIEKDKLLEYVEYVDNFYGTPSEPVIEMLGQGKNVILELEVNGAVAVKSRMPDAVTIFITPPSFTELERRLRMRGTESEEKIQARLRTALCEYQIMKKYDYIVLNESVSKAADELMSIICAENCRAARRIGKVGI